MLTITIIGVHFLSNIAIMMAGNCRSARHKYKAYKVYKAYQKSRQARLKILDKKHDMMKKRWEKKIEELKNKQFLIELQNSSCSSDGSEGSSYSSESESED